MIITTLKDFSRYESLHEAFSLVMDFLKTQHFSKNNTEEKIFLKDDDIFVMYSHQNGISKEEQVLEYHRKYLDIHLLLSGEETIGWRALSNCHNELSTFDKEKDFGTYSDKPTSFITLKPMEIAIIFPEDAHAPLIGTGKIEKLVVKIKI